MRISNQQILQSALRGLFSNLDHLHGAQEELTSGLKLRRPSDNPVDASTVARLESQLRGMERYRRASITATTRLSTEEAVLGTIDELLTQAKGLASAVESASDDPLRESALRDLVNVRDQILSMGNTRVGNEYIFAGTESRTRPFDEDGTFQGDGTNRQVEVEEGYSIEMNHSGDPLLTDVIAALDGLIADLESGAPEDIEAGLQVLEEARDGVRLAQAETGTRIKRLEEMQLARVERENVLEQQRQDLSVADPVESTVRLLEAQTALERAYAAVSRVISTSILQYLR